jgi:MFS family permease
VNLPSLRISARNVALPVSTAEARPAEPASPPLILRVYPALGNPAFRLLWLGLLPATLSFQMGVVVRPYVAFALTGSAAMLGLVSMANGLPMLLLCLVGGVVADRLPRRAVLMWTHVVFLVSAVIPAILLFTGRLEIWHLLVASLFQGAAMPFNMPARQAYIAQLAGRTMLPNAVALNNAGANFGRLVGPAVAGVLLAVPDIGIGLTFLAMAAMYVAALLTLPRLPASRDSSGTEVRSTPRPSGVAELIDGLKFTASSPSMLALLGMAAAMAIFGQQYQTLMTIFTERVYHVGAGGLGVLMTTAGLGALLGAIAVAAMTRVGRPAYLQLLLGIIFAAALIAFGLSPTYFVAMPVLMVVGFCGSAFMGLNSTLITSSAPPALYGRIMSIYMLTFAAQPLGAVPLAWLADAVGVQWSMLVAGAVVLMVVAGIGIFHVPYRRINWTPTSSQTQSM